MMYDTSGESRVHDSDGTEMLTAYLFLFFASRTTWSREPTYYAIILFREVILFLMHSFYWQL